MKRDLKPVEKETFKAGQEKAYLDPEKWQASTVIPAEKRLAIVLRYAKILRLSGLEDKSKYGRPDLDILDLGCGVGLLSCVLSGLGKVDALDYSKEGIRIAKGIFGYNQAIRFIEADAQYPGNIPELKQKAYDLIVMRAFHPLYRNIIGKRNSTDIIADYFGMLKPGGIIIIEHALRIRTWREREDILQTAQIVKRFNAMAANMLSLDLMLGLCSALGIKQLKGIFLASRLLTPFEFLLTLLTGRNLSKVIVIKRT